MSTSYPSSKTDGKPFVSIVVPIYNGASFIPLCLESIICQDVDFGYEIICVNDGSTDNSSEICKKYSQRYPFIRLIEQNNGGVTAARQSGVMASVGEWICFVDIDDIMPKNALKLLANDCSDEYDIIVGEMISETTPQVMSNREYRKKIICGEVAGSPCAKLYRKALFTPETLSINRSIVYGEDMIMNIRLAFHTEKPVRFIGKIVYTYIRNTSSASHTFKKTAEYEDMFADTLKLSIPEDLRSDQDYAFARILCKINGWRGMNFLSFSIKENRETQFYKNLVSEIKEYAYPLSWQNRIHIYGKSVFSRAIAIVLDLLPIVKYKISSRLHSGK